MYRSGQSWSEGSSAGGSSGAPPVPAPRRRSTRDIKRTKFDDEIVQSGSGIPTKSPRKPLKLDEGPFPSGPGQLRSAPPTAAASPIMIKEEPKDVPIQPPPARPSTSASHVNVSGGKSQKRRAVRGKGSAVPSSCPSPNHTVALEDLGRWTPTDDLALITAVMQTNDLEKVQTGIKFSCKFTLEEVQERWYALLYDPHISKMAVEGMRELALDTVIRVQSNTLFKKSEETVLGSIPSTADPRPTLETFAALLEKNADVFHHSRTPASLMAHWAHLGEYRLLPDQQLAHWPPPKEAKELALAELEANLAAEGDVEPVDPVAEAEALLAERALNRELGAAAAEMGKWTVAVEAVTGISPPDFDPRTMAVLRGRLVRFLVRSREITIGRSTPGGLPVDVDLALEAPAAKVSRRQATIRCRHQGEFYIANDGKRPLYVDGKPLLTLTKTRLHNNTVIEVANIRLVFLINNELMASMRAETTKMMTA